MGDFYYPSVGLTKTIGGESIPAWTDWTGQQTYSQPNFADRRVSYVTIPGQSGGFVDRIGQFFTETGTRSWPSLDTTNTYRSMSRMEIESAAGAGSTAEFYMPQLVLSRGTTTRRAGFKATTTFGFCDTSVVAGARCFIGVSPSSPGNNDPSSRTDIFGFGCDSGESSLSVIHNDSSGVATKVALGASFPTNTSRVDLYRAMIAAPYASNVMYYYIVNVDTGAEASGVISANLPDQGQFLGFRIYRNNAAVATAVKIGFSSIYLEEFV